MHTEKEAKRGCRAKLPLILILSALVCLAATGLVVNLSPRLLIMMLGLEPLGSLAEVLPPAPSTLELSGKPLDHITFLLPPQVAEPSLLTLPDAAGGGVPESHLIGETSTPGRTTYLLTLGEHSLNQLLREHDVITGSDNNRYHNVTLELEPGGLILYADVNLGLRQQRVGLLLLHDQGALTVTPAGVVLRGNVYGAARPGPIAQLFLPRGRQVEHAFQTLRIVGPLSGEARAESLRVHHESIQIQAEATYAVSSQEDTGWQLVEPGMDLREIDVPAGEGQLRERLSIVRMHPGMWHMRVHYSPTNPLRISGWGDSLNALLVVNGGYFAPESVEGHETIGMLISDGRRWGTPLHDHAGMLAVTPDGQVSVRWLRQQPYNPAEALSQAVQSFPVLVKPGGLMGFPADADDGAPARRTVVAQDQEDSILLIVAPRGALSLHQLAVFLAESDLSIDVALNLDGGGSTGMWLAAESHQMTVDSLTSVPSAIAVERQ